MDNIDNRVVRGFGEEWSSYDQESLNQNESKELFDRYFNIFPNDALSDDKVGIDIGCGSGRWAKHIAPLVKELYCIDASEQALNVAKKNLIIFANAVEEQLLLHGIDCGGRKQQKLLTWFENEVSTGALWQKRDIDSPFLFTLSRWRDFYNESVVGYVKSESFCKGGEFIFMNVDIQAVIGSKIWFRRLIKRSNNIFVDHGT